MPGHRAHALTFLKEQDHRLHHARPGRGDPHREPEPWPGDADADPSLRPMVHAATMETAFRFRAQMRIRKGASSAAARPLTRIVVRSQETGLMARAARNRHQDNSGKRRHPGDAKCATAQSIAWRRTRPRTAPCSCVAVPSRRSGLSTSTCWTATCRTVHAGSRRGHRWLAN